MKGTPDRFSKSEGTGQDALSCSLQRSVVAPRLLEKVCLHARPNEELQGVGGGGGLGRRRGEEVDQVFWTTCFSPEAEGTEGALSMPDVEMGNQLATALIHILPTWRGGRVEGLRKWGLPRVFEDVYSAAGAMQGTVGRHEVGAKAGRCLEWI